jgi:hypothetical protein
MLSQISEIDSEDIEATSPNDGGSNGDTTHYGSGFPYSSWNDTQSFSENLIGLKRGRSGNEEMFSDFQVCLLLWISSKFKFLFSILIFCFTY